jgi:anaerobic magnesium-protoporphyrin IX monomethyl ester cyclase
LDVVLIQPKHRFSRDPRRRTNLPLGLLSVATPLDVAGYKVKIIVQETEPDWEATLLAELKTKPICVGITVMTGPQIWWGLKASEMVKRRSDVPVVWGGVHPSLTPRQTLENQYVDIVVQGEGEETFFELVGALANRRPLDKIMGIWYKDGGQIRQNQPRPFIDLNQQPPISYHLVDIKAHLETISGRRYLGIQTSRGCPFACAFCYNTCFNQRRWRALTAEQTLLRMKHMVDEYGVNGIRVRDDNFFVNPDRAHQILSGILQQKLDITWDKGDIRLDLLSKIDDDFLGLIERSGCRFLSIGIESGSQRILDILRKEIDVSQALPVNRRLAKYNMIPKYQFLFGIPGETEADLAESAALMLRLVDENPKAREGLQVFVPYPGSELFDLAVQHGLAAPRKLEDWVAFSWSNRRPDYPWLSPEVARLIQTLSFCGVFLPGDRNLRPVSPFISLVARLYRPIARKRVRGLNHRFLVEPKVAGWLGFRGY